MTDNKKEELLTPEEEGLKRDVVAKYVAAIEGAPEKKKFGLQKALRLQAYYVVKAMYRVMPVDSLESFLLGATKETTLAVVQDKENILRGCAKAATGSDALSPKQYDHLRRFIDAVNFVTDSRKDLRVRYEETALYEEHEVVCPVCGGKMRFERTAHDSYICPNGCTKVSCHPFTAMPEGIPATANLRKMRQQLHGVTDHVFRGNRKQLYCFMARMIGRPFNSFDGHIGSMNESECEKMLALFRFLGKRGEHLENVRGISRVEYLLEEYFLSHADHTEAQAYYFLVKSGFAFDALKPMFDLTGPQYRLLLASMVAKGLPLSTNISKVRLSSELMTAIIERKALVDRLVKADKKKQREFIFF